MVRGMVAEGVFGMGLWSSYCSSADVLRLLAGYDLSRIGDSDQVQTRVQELMATARCALDHEAGRDFLYHADDEVVVDGKGRDKLVLATMGIYPVVRVQELRVSGEVVPAEEYVSFGEEGTIRLKNEGKLLGTFPRGVMNVHLTVDWGYVTAPADIALAQAKLVAAEVLAEGTGAKGAVSSLRIGDYAVSYDEGGENAGTVLRWVTEARKAARSYRRIGLVAV